MVYSLLPHVGDWRAEVVPAAYDLNDPLIVHRISAPVAKAGSRTLQGSLVTVDAANVIIETIKAAEDGKGLIVRLYENQRNRGKVTITAGFALAEAYHCNLLESDGQSLPVTGNAVTIEIGPYQQGTLTSSQMSLRRMAQPIPSTVKSSSSRKPMSSMCW